MVRDSENEITFEVTPKKTFFGLDKGKSHCFTAPKEINEFAIKTFGLGEGHLQAEIQFEIEERLYPATIRLVRINRSKPYKLKAEDLESREVIQFQWKKFHSTQNKLAHLGGKTEDSHDSRLNFLFEYNRQKRFKITRIDIGNVSIPQTKFPPMSGVHKLYADHENYPKDDLLTWFWISIGDPWQPTILPESTEQKGRIIFSGAGVASDIDAMSTVPFIRERGKSPVEIAKTLQSKSNDQWQRELKFERAASIGNWWDDHDSQMLNPVVLKMKNNIDPFKENEIKVSCKVTGIEKILQPIVFEPWQVDYCQRCNRHFKEIILNDHDYKADLIEIFDEIGSKYDKTIPIFSDQCMNKQCPDYSIQIGHRPFLVADGQHRIRGTQHPNADTNHHESIIYTLMPPNPGSQPSTFGFTDDDSGKIFTDINVRAAGLVPNHKLNMAWRFGIDNAKIWRDKDEYDFSTSGTRASRSYEAILEVTTGVTHGTRLVDNPFYGKIYTMEDEESNEHNSLVKLKQLFEDHIYPKTDPGDGARILERPWSSLSATRIGHKLVEFARAIRNIWHGTSASGEPFWAPNYKGSRQTQPETNPTGDYWGVISHRKRVDDGQTGALETLFNLYDEICFCHNSITSFTPVPPQSVFETYLDLISELEFTWYVSGEKFRGWVFDFCRDIIRGTGAGDSIVNDEVKTNSDLLIKLGLPKTPNLNDLLLSKIWLHHPTASSSTSSVELPEIVAGGLLEDSSSAKATMPVLPVNSVIEVIQPFNCFGNFVISAFSRNMKINILTSRTSNRKVNHKTAPATNSEDGIHEIEINDIIAGFHSEHSMTLGKGDQIIINIFGKNALDDSSERNFCFELA